MKINFTEYAKKHENEFYGFLHQVNDQDKKLMVSGDLTDLFEECEKKHDFCNDELKLAVEHIEESISLNNTIYLDVREQVGESSFFMVNLEEQFIDKADIKTYLMAKENFAQSFMYDKIPTLNFKPFYDKSPKVRDIKNIGSGVEYLNRFLSSQMITDTEKWKENIFNFIRLHKYESEQLILNDRIDSVDMLEDNVEKAINILSEKPAETEYKELKHNLQDLGFEKGLGKNAGEILKSIRLLDNLLNTPDHLALTEFLARIPMIFNITIVSTHGFFAQEGVLGMPDTGGQVVYILDQVKALEKQMIENLQRAGLNVLPKIIVLTRLIPNAGKTTCNKRLEKIHNTKNSWILRVPFREHNKKVTDNWISRFEIYPYLEDFAEDAYIELMAEFGGRPDLVIGNYSDGNLISYILSKRFGITQCCIAHALEKSKYLYSALYWQGLDDEYHFSLQFTADLLAINSADFLITSSFQEIAGTDYAIGQYESYKHFTMPGLYRVLNGVNLKHTKFNIVSPGVNSKVYFPYHEEKRRIKEVQHSLKELLFENKEDPEVVGFLEDPHKTPIFSMARLDKIKNLTALARWFGESPEMQENANLIIVSGKVDASQSSDREEIEQIHIMHDILNKYQLHNKVRWIGKLFKKNEAGEVYRIIADRKGIFVQPGLFEGFGLTVLEAMVSGLPVFATKYGGPLEIIQNKLNGFHIDPVDDQQCIEKLCTFISDIEKDPSVWDKMSKAAVKRVQEKYNWELYSRKLLALANIYGFWKYSTDMEMEDLDAYLDIIYHMVFKQRAYSLLEKHNNM